MAVNYCHFNKNNFFDRNLLAIGKVYYEIYFNDTNKQKLILVSEKIK